MTEQMIFDWYIDNGLSPAGASGMTANINIESAYNSKNLQNSYEKKLGYTDQTYTAAVDSGKYKNFSSDRAGYGYCQWTSAGRKAGLLAYAKENKVSIGDPLMQLEYSLKEMSKSLKSTLQTITDPYEAAVQVMTKFERPANQSADNQAARGNKGKEVYARCYKAHPAKAEDATKGDTEMGYKIYKHYLTKNRCYVKGEKLNPSGIVVHSTGCNNKNVTRYVDMPELGTVSPNHWNSGNKTLSKCVHFIIGWSEKLKQVVIVQTLPLDMRCWGCGSGSKGSYNANYIQFEICEDGLTDQTYFNQVMDAAQWLCRYLMDECNIPLSKVVSHKEAHAEGYASNHGDPDHWLKKFGRDMNWFRKNIPAKAETGSSTSVNSAAGSSLIAKLQTVTQKKDTSLKGTWTVSDPTGAELRYGAGASKYASMGNLPKGTPVNCYGYYELDEKGNKWLYVTYGKQVGFIAKSILKR